MMQQTIRAVYEDGVLRPLEPINLPDQQVVELHIQTAGEQRRIAHLGGSWAAYISGGVPSFEEIQDLTHMPHSESLDRLLNQLSSEQRDDNG